MLIRTAVDKDLPIILEIMNEAIVNTTALYDYDPKDENFINDWFKTKQVMHYPIVVAELDGEVCGYGTYGSFRQKDAYKFCVEHSVYVHKNFHGKGIGKALLKALIRNAKAADYHTMIAGIDAANEGSCAFHKSLGFVEVGRLKEVGYKFNRWLDLVFMQLMLTDDVMAE